MSCLFVDELTVMDFSYLHPHRGLLGESWIVDIEMHGELGEAGMVFDFAKCKKTIKSFIDNWADHKLIVSTLDAKIAIKQKSKYVELKYFFGEAGNSGGKNLYYNCPEEALCLVDINEITPQGFTPLLEKKLLEIMPSNVNKLKVMLREEAINTPYYHYSHGLKKHDGNCQRMAHGHRSKIEIWENGQLSSKWMTNWSNLWRDIYIASLEDKVLEDKNSFHFKYRSPQGVFELHLPKDCCYLMENDTTVERIAEHIAQKIKSVSPKASIRVKAYEGYRKGAQFTC